ncbi:hypothetical protein C8R44DRAFT_309682 [Mycena epipterygia]|nr:hypothetical protein C8R44DRAFT_309682 [Mycena epipterygia]
MTTDAVLPWLSVIVTPLRSPLPTTEVAVILPRRIPPIVVMVGRLLRLPPLSMIAMIEDLMSDTLRIPLRPVVEPEPRPGFAKTTIEPRHLGTIPTTAVALPRHLRRVTRTITLEAVPRMPQLRDTGAALRVPLPGRRVLRTSKAMLVVAGVEEEALLATVMPAVLPDLGIIHPLHAMAATLPIPAATGGLEAPVEPPTEKNMLLY